MHTIRMTMQQVQVNTKFLNALPSEWSKFITDVKLAKSLYTTNYDHLYAYLSQHERHANEVRIVREIYLDPLALVAGNGYVKSGHQRKKDKTEHGNKKSVKDESEGKFILKDSSAEGTDNRPPMLEESDYESWKICIERYIKGKTHGKLIWKSILNGPSAHP
nr:hypothetical protein [Tanacetum cinerariifolium]